MPSTAVYFVSPRRIAAMAASLMLSGVSKSGSPAPSPITSRPAAFRSRAFCVTAIVGDGWIRPSDSERKPLGNGLDGVDMIPALAIKGMDYQSAPAQARVKPPHSRISGLRELVAGADADYNPAADSRASWSSGSPLPR